MPVLDWFELCKKIMEIDKNIEVIFITAGEEYYEEFRKQPYPELTATYSAFSLIKDIWVNCIDLYAYYKKLWNYILLI